MVALSDAWQKGAQQWTDDRRRDFANDPLELLAVDGPANGAEGRRRRRHLAPAEQALPLRLRHPPGRIKAKYGLWVTQAEHDAMQRVLGSCPPR